MFAAKVVDQVMECTLSVCCLLHLSALLPGGGEEAFGAGNTCWVLSVPGCERLGRVKEGLVNQVADVRNARRGEICVLTLLADKQWRTGLCACEH